MDFTRTAAVSHLFYLRVKRNEIKMLLVVVMVRRERKNALKAREAAQKGRRERERERERERSAEIVNCAHNRWHTKS